MAQLAQIGLLMLVALVSCDADDGRPRYVVTGEVLLDGEPLAEGTLLFYPTTGDHDADVGTISQGRFSLKATTGQKRVEIEASKLSDKTEPSALGGEPVRMRVSIIPPRYNRESTLTVEVKAMGKNRFRFELTTAP